MQIQETIEYNVKSLRHADNVPIQSPKSLEGWERVSIKEPDKIRKRDGYNVKI